MRHLLKTTALASSLVAASFFVGTGVARAQEVVEVEFTSNVPLGCFFGAPDPGTLSFDDDRTFSSIDGGTSGTVALTCNAPFTFLVSEPLATTTPPDVTIESGTGSFAQATIPGAGDDGLGVATDLTATSTGGEEIAVNSVDGATVEVDMVFVVDGTDPVPPGDYTFTVTLTATPQ